MARHPGSLALGLALPLLPAVAVACGGSDASSPLPPEAEHGRRIARTSGCTACHGADGQGGVGPAWTGSVGKQVTLTDGSTVTVDEAYLARSITDPDAQVLAGFDVKMPDNDLSAEEVDQVVAYILALNAPAGSAA
jgi:cytochrome c oxidase subunit II